MDRNNQGQFLTDSGSKIPLAQKKDSGSTVRVPPKPNLSATNVKNTNYVEMANKPLKAGSRIGSVPNLTRQVTASSLRAPANASGTGFNRAKTQVATSTRRAGATASVAATNTTGSALKRTVGGNLASGANVAAANEQFTGDGVTPAKVAKKSGFPYQSSKWDAKNRLVECEQWLVDERSRSQELENELSEIKSEVESLRTVKEQLRVEKEKSSLLDTNLNQKISEFNKLDIETRCFQDKLRTLENELKRQKDENNSLQENLSKLRQEVFDFESENSKLKRSLDDLEYKLKRKTSDLENSEKMYNQSKNDLQETCERLRKIEYNLTDCEKKLSESQLDCENKFKTIKDLEEKLQRTSDKLSETTKRLDEEKNISKTLKGDFELAQNEIKDLNNNLDASKRLIEELTGKLCDGDKHRRFLHNTVQDLKGNIRVFCRVRPPLANEKENCLMCSINYPDEGSIEISKYDPLGENTNSNLPVSVRAKFPKHEFSFDRVFPPGATQAAVFEELEQLVQSALDGYNVCIFAYGQTGSGKTYTMEGMAQEERRGMIPRTVQHIFNTIEELKKIGWVYTVDVCFIEIYNETLRDLLQAESSPTNTAGLKIMQVDAKTNDVVIPGLTVMKVESFDDLDRLYQLAHQSRVTASTAYNERSSRSHSVTKIKVVGVHQGRGETCYGSLNLVDLAGSERLHESMNANDPRFREMKNINKSLSELGNVILSLYQKNDHIPYRNSKLTHLLQPALGGSSKTLMLVNISPIEGNLSETLCSLRFAKKVNEVKVGSSRKRIAYEAK